jgi:opacity protein-like surface antigen
MKKFNLSLAAMFAMGTFAVAGGDIAPVEPVVEEPVVVESTGNFYVGLAYGFLSTEVSNSYTYNDGTTLTPPSLIDDDFSEIMIQAGYNFNEYVAIEGRYWFGLSETLDFHDWDAHLADHDTTIDAWGIYVKPQYSFDAFKIYALLGYAGADMTVDNVGSYHGLEYTTDDVDGFSWGLGAAYAFTDNVEVFVDYVSIYDDDESYVALNYTEDVDRSINTWNFGITYNF